MKLLVNPSATFIIIWVTLVSFFSLGVLNINVPFSWEAIFVVAANIFLAVCLLVVSMSQPLRFNVEALKQELMSKEKYIKRYVRCLFFVYVFISLLDVIYSGGVPLVWKLSGDDRMYVDFGIPTLHGIANCIVFFLASLCMLLGHLGVARSRLILLFIFAWQLIIFSRGVIMVMLVQMLCVYLFLFKPALKQYLILFLLGACVVVFFGMLGDLRQGENPYYGMLAPEWKGFFEYVPSGVLWIYVYLVSGFNNLLFNVPLIEPSYLPMYTFAKLVPSVVYNLLGVEKAIDSFVFVQASLNVSTIYSGFYSDFGLFAFLPVFFIQLIAALSFMKAKAGSIYALLAFSVCYQAIVLSPFIDTFFYLPFIAQFLIVWHFKKVMKNARA